jgi:mannose-6-phosphate isomerase
LWLTCVTLSEISPSGLSRVEAAGNGSQCNKSNEDSAQHHQTMKLERRFVEKPWGRTRLPPIFNGSAVERIGEIWFVGPPDPPLLAKYLFTSERLSVQVHPDDEQARLRGLPGGKSECWYILDAEPGATIGLGLRRELTRDELRAAALDGSIVEEMEWRPVAAGDFLYVPAGTIHAVGAGISLVEFQQSADVTYRLYDYGRPRELHLDDAVAVSRREPYPGEVARHVDEREDVTLVNGPHFVLLHGHGDALQDRKRWILPLSGTVHCKDEAAGAGECLFLEPGEPLETDGARLLIGAVA